MKKLTFTPFDDRILIENFIEGPPPAEGTLGGIIVPPEVLKKELEKENGFYRVAKVISSGVGSRLQLSPGDKIIVHKNNVEVIEVGEDRWELVRDLQVIGLLR